MATVFRFKQFDPDDKLGKSSLKDASGGKKTEGNRSLANDDTCKMEACQNPDNPNFDWGQYQDFHFVNIDKHTLHLDKDRHLVRAHVMNDLNKKERLRKKFKVSWFRFYAL